MLIGVIFLSCFSVISVLLFGFFSGGSRQSKRTLSRLKAIGLQPQNAAIATDPLAIRRVEVLSMVPWMDQLLRKADITARLRLLLYQADLRWTVARLLLTSFLFAVVCGGLVYLRTQAFLASFAAFLFAGYMPFVFVIRKRNSRFLKMKQILPEAVDTMVAAIRAGHSFAAAMGTVAREAPEPVRSEFRQCFEEQNFGLDLRTAMLNLAHRAPIRDIRVIVVGVLIQKETGGNLTEILEKIAHIIREDFRLERQVQVHTAQGRMTGWILSLLPLALGFGLYLVNPEHMSILWTRPIGLKLLYGSSAMAAIGILLIRRIVRVRI